MARQCTKPKRPRNSTRFKEKEMLAEALESGMVLDEEQMAFLANNRDTVTSSQWSLEISTLAAFQTDDLDAFDFDCDEAPFESAVLMAKLSSYDLDILSEYSEQPVFNNDTDIDITSNSNMISYEQYLNETKNTVVQDTSSSAQQEAMVMSVIEKMNNQVAECNEVDKENKIINESLAAELERYKEQIKLFKERKQFDLNDREKYIYGQLRKVIVEKNAKGADFENRIHSLKQQLNETVKSHKTLSTMVDVLKIESKVKEDKYLNEIIELEKQKKALDNVIYKMCQSTQTMHMLTKPQAFYDETHKTVLGYQNPLDLSQAQRKVPALYCGNTIVKQHATLSVIDTEETLKLAEESRLKMHAKQNDPIVQENKVNIAHIDYVALNKLSEHFVPQKQLSTKQAFWLPISKPVSDIPPVQPEPVLKEISRELPIISLDKDSFNKMRSHVNDFENVVIAHTKVTGQNEGSWGFEHIWKAFDKDVKPFVKTLKEKTFEIKEKELLLENDRLLELLLSQDLVYTVVNSLAKIIDYQRMEKSFLDEYSERVKLKAKLSKKMKWLKRLFMMNFQNDVPDWKTDLEANNNSISKLKDHIATLKGKGVSECDKSKNISKVIAPGMYKIDLEPLSPKLLKNKEAHVDYLKHTHENANTLREIVEQARELRPLDSDLDFALVPPKKSLSTTEVKKTSPSSNTSRKLKDITNVGSSSKSKNVESNIPKNSKPIKNWGSNVSTAPSSSRVHFRLFKSSSGHNLFSMDQFCDSDLEVAFYKHTCYVRALEDVDLLKRSRGSNLYTMSLEEMMQSSPICLLSKASKTSRGYSIEGKSKKHTHKPNSDDSIQEKLYLLHMDLCGPIRIESINGKKYILVIVDDYSRFTWVKFLRLKDETTEIVIILLKKIQDSGKLKPKLILEFLLATHLLRRLTESIKGGPGSMASIQFSSGPELQLMTLGTISLRVVQNPPSTTPYVPPTKND
ncbi:retrovirus-related pol polyprotein from transposon TNT 1-94 [Tanacetum coccineum]